MWTNDLSPNDPSDMPSTEVFVEGSSVSMGLKINGKGGGVCIVEHNGKEYTGVYGSYGTGAEVEFEGELSGATFVIWKNY